MNEGTNERTQLPSPHRNNMIVSLFTMPTSSPQQLYSELASSEAPEPKLMTAHPARRLSGALDRNRMASSPALCGAPDLNLINYAR